MAENAQKELPVLITGAAGFIGWRLAHYCEAQGQPVVLVDCLSHFEDRPEHTRVSGQILDRENLFDWFEQERPALQGIFHLGACTDTTLLDTTIFDRLNLRYSQDVWNLATKNEIPLVYASSAATYGDGHLGYEDKEEQIPSLLPLNPYAESKQHFDLWALEQASKGNCPPAWSGFKFFNVFGFGERHKGKMASVFLQAFDQITQTGKVKLFKSEKSGILDGDQKRDFIHVEDAIRILWFAHAKKVPRGIFNLGTGTARSFKDLAEITFRALGKTPNIEYIPMPDGLAARYQYYTQASMQKVRALGYRLNFQSLEEGGSRYIQQLAEQSLTSFE